MFRGLFGERQELELAKVLNLTFGTFHRVYSRFGLTRVLGTIEDLENLEVSINDDQLMGFYFRAEDLKGFYFRLFRKAATARQSWRVAAAHTLVSRCLPTSQPEN